MTWNCRGVGIEVSWTRILGFGMVFWPFLFLVRPCFWPMGLQPRQSTWNTKFHTCATMPIENRHVQTYSCLVSALDEHRNVLNFAAPQKVAFSASLRFFSKSFFPGFSFLFLRCMNIQCKVETRARPTFQAESNHIAYDICAFLLHPVATGAESIFSVPSALQSKITMHYASF